MNVRVASLADLEAIVPMMIAFNHEEAIAWTRAAGEPALRRLLGDPGLGQVLLADGVGYAVLTWGFDLEWNGRDAFLTELFIQPAARGQGLGRQLLLAVEAAARAAGAAAVHLMVRHENKSARALYDSVGFKDPERALLSKRL